jgi:hypothetical protein
MVRFQKFSKDIYVIVDDRLPVDGSGNIVFGRSEDEDESVSLKKHTPNYMVVIIRLMVGSVTL